MGFSIEDIVKVIDNGFSSAFLERGARRRYRAEALHKIVSILREEGFDTSNIVNDLQYHDAGVNFNMKIRCVLTVILLLTGTKPASVCSVIRTGER